MKVLNVCSVHARACVPARAVARLQLCAAFARVAARPFARTARSRLRPRLVCACSFCAWRATAGVCRRRSWRDRVPMLSCRRSMATMSRRTARVRSLDWVLRFRHPLSHGCVCACVCVRFPCCVRACLTCVARGYTSSTKKMKRFCKIVKHTMKSSSTTDIFVYFGAPGVLKTAPACNLLLVVAHI